MTAKLIYIATRSLDGYIEDEQGKIDWTSPDEKVHQFVNDLARPVGTYLYGRRMYETMQVWTQLGSSESDPASVRDFAGMWRAAEKVVYSKTLKQVSTPRTRLEQTFDVDAIREMKLRAAHDLGIGGHELAAHAFRAGLVDEMYLFVVPIIIGGGKQAFPDGVRLQLELVDERRFEGSGVLHLHYRLRAR
jgi:dihydrofolate reductase